MLYQLFLMPMAALFQGVAIPEALPQEPVERKVKIEIVTTENGETKRVTKEFNAANEAEMEEALREMGVMDHFTFDGDDEDMMIDIHRFGSDGDRDMTWSIAPLPPVPPVPPIAPGIHGEERAYLGVQTEELSDALRKEKKIDMKKGVFVSKVVDDSPAEEMGLKEGDVITAVDGKEIASPKELTDAIRSHEPGDKVKVTYQRAGKSNTMAVELGAKQSSSYAYAFGPEHGSEEWDWETYMGDTAWTYGTRAFLGVTPGDESEDAAGAVIGSVEEGTAAEKMGIVPGDAITRVDGDAVADFEALSKAIKSHAPGDDVAITVVRDGKEQVLKGQLGERKGHRAFNGMDAPHMYRFRSDGMAPEDREAFRREMDEMRREMNELRREMGKDMRRETRITIEKRTLSDEEKAVLRKKGVAGLETELKLGDMQVFPNPSNGFYRLHFDVADHGDLLVNVHDAAGEKVYEERITGFKGRYERTLDLSDKATGSYFLVITQNGRTSTQKLVKE